MRIGERIRCAVLAVLLGATAAGCTGNGEGLNQNGQPISSSSSSSSVALTADFSSIQDNVFTPICTRCHIGASAPQGLQLDAAHSYSLLVGVPSQEEPSILRVNPGNPNQSYLILKLEGAAGIVGGQMPLGGPYLPQSTIDTIAQWITDGAPPASTSQSMGMQSMEQLRRPPFEVVAVSPAELATVRGPLTQVVVAFSSEVDASLVNSTTIVLERVTGDELLTPTGPPLGVSTALATGNPSTLIVHPNAPLGPGMYRLTLRGTGGGALANVSAVTLGADEQFVFTVEAAP
jgi:Bacterial Ig-like domain